MSQIGGCDSGYNCSQQSMKSSERVYCNKPPKEPSANSGMAQAYKWVSMPVILCVAGRTTVQHARYGHMLCVTVYFHTSHGASQEVLHLNHFAMTLKQYFCPVGPKINFRH